MTRTDCARELIASILGVSGARLDALLDIYAEAKRLDVEETSPPQEDTPAEEKEGKPGPKPGSGAGEAGREAAALKKVTHRRLVEYREKHGLGSYVTLSKLSGGALTDDDLRGMERAEKLPQAKWRLLAAALDKAEKEEKRESEA